MNVADDDLEMPEQEANPDYALIDDMIIGPEQYDILFNNVTRRNGYTQVVRMWPNATVPYLLDNNFSKTFFLFVKLANFVLTLLSH